MQNSPTIIQSVDNNLKLANTFNNRGLAYGDGFFSTMGVKKGQILWAEYHHKRLQTHAKALQLSIDADDIMEDLTNQAKQMGEGVLKVVITRQPQNVRGYGFNNGEVEVLTKAMPMAIYSQPNVSYQAGIAHQLQNLTKDFIAIQPPITAVCLTAQIACLPKPLAGLKTLNRLDNVLASGELESKKRQYTDLNYPLVEGLVQDVTGSWVEGTMSNVFYCLANKKGLYTPPLDSSGVNGVMRQVLMDMPTLEITERKLQDEDLAHISTMFFTNAVRGVMPVNSLMLPSGKFLKLKSVVFND